MPRHPSGPLLVVLVLLACGDDAAPEPESLDPHPEPPSIIRDVAMIDDAGEWTHPFVPGHRTTQDGRVAIRVQGGPPGGERLSTMLSFFLFAPERLDEPVMPGPSGARILAEASPIDVAFPPALDPEVEVLGHHAICDATTEFPFEGERPNPQPCEHALDNDCYDFTVISTTSIAFESQMWGTPVTIEVAEPKTRDAHIVDVTLGEPVPGMLIPLTREFTEPAVTVDGRLLTGRLGRSTRTWVHPDTGETFVRSYDLAYSLLPEGADPCDVTGWTEFHPMSHAPFDPAMRGYGLAAYPFRDTEGNPIPDGEDMGGTYPWVDREGANIFMTGVHGRIVEQSEQRFPRRCVHEGCDAYEENNDWDRGFMIAGLWTHGKLVHLDGMINNQDWAVGVAPETHWWVDMYRNDDASMMPIRFGSGRFIVELRGGIYPPGYTHNANILDSVQNLPNFHVAAQPVTPRDVVWLMSSGVATDEIAFDDFLDPHALIVSNMQASITQVYDRRGFSTALPHHHNGQVRGRMPIAAFSPPLDADADEDIHIQNAATSLDIEVPAYGLVEAGTGRVEPIALGGVHGRGFWLSGDNRIRYALAEQDLDERDAFIGIFVDTRAGGERTLLAFADGTDVVLDGTILRYLDRGRSLHEVELPEKDGWRHLGWRLGDAHRRITLLVDGFAYDRFDAAEPMFSLDGGELVVGARDAERGVRGWIDDFVVLVHDVNPEVACNHAAGTLVRVDDAPAWNAVAATYPDWAHAAVASAAGEPMGRFACFHDYSGDYRAHLRNTPTGTTSLREAINFPEGPIRAGTPRPDSSSNAFCLSCHHESGHGGLGLGALEWRPDVVAEDDPRRQPLQPPRRVFGNIPPNWLPNAPSEPTRAPLEGLLIDPFL